MLLAWVFCLASCVTRSKCADKFPCKIGDTTTFIKEVEKIKIVKEKDTVIETQKVIEYITIKEIQALPKGKRFVKQSNDGNTEIGITKDSLGNLTIDCGKKDIIIKKLTEQVQTLEKEKNSTIKTKQEAPIVIKYIPKWIQSLALVGATTLLTLLIFIYIKFRKGI